jgi:ribosomal protein L11 methyltransferase
MVSNSRKRWFLITVSTNSQTREAIGNFLFEKGATGLVETDQALEAFYPGTIDIAGIAALLHEYFDELANLGFAVDRDAVAVREVEDQDWNAEWKKDYHAIRVTERIMIRPSWEEIPDYAPAIVIQIDPEMAFGTGTHATTRLCLRLMEEHFQPNLSILDIGTGTGILAIAAVKMGAAKTVGLDIDPLATATAKKNAWINGASDKICLFTGTLAALRPSPFDLVLANVNREQILKNLPMMKEMLDYRSKLVLSGLLIEEEGIVRETLVTQGMSVHETAADEEWLAIVASIRM